MARVLDKNKPFVEVFGTVDENERDKDGMPHVPHRFRQYGMKFDEQGKLIGPELPVPHEGVETEAEMRTRLEKEIRAQIAKEHEAQRERIAASAKGAGGENIDEESDKASGKGKGGR